MSIDQAHLIAKTNATDSKPSKATWKAAGSLDVRRLAPSGRCLVGVGALRWDAKLCLPPLVRPVLTRWETESRNRVQARNDQAGVTDLLIACSMFSKSFDGGRMPRCLDPIHANYAMYFHSGHGCGDGPVWPTRSRYPGVGAAVGTPVA